MPLVNNSTRDIFYLFACKQLGIETMMERRKGPEGDGGAGVERGEGHGRMTIRR